MKFLTPFGGNMKYLFLTALLACLAAGPLSAGSSPTDTPDKQKQEKCEKMKTQVQVIAAISTLDDSSSLDPSSISTCCERKSKALLTGSSTSQSQEDMQKSKNNDDESDAA